MNEDYTFQQAVHAIDRATITGRVFPRSLHDNVTSDLHDAGDRMLLLDWHHAADRDAWLGYFGTREPVNGVHWADGWHGWTVVLTAHREDSGAGAATSCTTPAPVSVEVLAEGEATAAELMAAPCDECGESDCVDYACIPRFRCCGVEWDDPHADDCPTRRTGKHSAVERGAALAPALLDPDATITLPCQQATQHEPHGTHTRHVGAYSRHCAGWAGAPTVPMPLNPVMW